MVEEKICLPIEIKERNSLKRALEKGSVFTRLSCFVMGFGHIARGQLIKGLLFMLTQLAFLLYMIFAGGRY